LLLATIVYTPPCSIVAAQLPPPVSRSTYGKIYYDPFTSDTSGQYEAVPTASCAVFTSGGYFSGEGYLRVYTDTSAGSGGTGQASYARMQYKTSVSRGVVVIAYVKFDSSSGDEWATLWYMGSSYQGYKLAGKRWSDAVKMYKQTGESSYSELASQGSSWNGEWCLVLFTADSSSVLRGYWQNMNWESAPSDSTYSSGKIGFGGRQDYNKWSHFVIMSSRSITVNGLQSGWTVDIYSGTTVAITGTATGSSLTLDTWSAMKINYVPPYTKFVIRNGATVLYNSASAGQFSNDIYGGDVYSYTASVTSTVTNFLYASSTARITSSTTSTTLNTLFNTQTVSTTTATTTSQVMSTIPFSTTTYSTTFTTRSSASSTTRTTTTTTSYAGPSSTTTLLTTTGTTTTTTGTSTTTSYATTTTTSATSLSTDYSTSAASTSIRTTTATVLTSTNYQYSTTTIGTYVTTTLTAVIGTTTTTAGNTIILVYTERRQVVTSYTERIRESRQDFGRVNIDTIVTQMFQFIQTTSTSFLTTIQQLWTDVVTFFKTSIIGSTEKSVVYTPMDVQVTIDSNPQGSGFIKVDGEPYTTPHTFSWKWGEVHQIEALSPASGAPGIQYVFLSWSDEGNQIHVITVQDPVIITANYKVQYLLNMQTGPSGAVSPQSGWYDTGTPVEIQATANEGYLFSGWLGVGEGSYNGPENPHTITMNAPITQTAQCGEWRVSITFALSDIDQVTGTIITIDGAPYSYSDFPKSFSWIVGTGHNVAASTPISAGSGEQYVFSSWTNGDGLFGASGTYAVPTSDQIVTAVYKTQYQLTIEVNNPAKGTTNPVPGAYWYDSTSNVPVNAVPNPPGNQLGHWKLDGNNVGSANPYTVLMDGAHTLQAFFEASQVAVYITTYPADGRYVLVDGQNVTTPWSGSWAQHSGPHTIKANTPIGNSRFKEWDDGSTQNPRSVTAQGDEMYFQAIYVIQYQLTVSTSPTGISPQPTIQPTGGPWYDSGTVVTLTAQQVAGMNVRYWKVDGVSQDDGIAQIQIVMSTDQVAVAYYAYVGGPHSQPSITFSFTAPVVTPLFAVLALIACVIIGRRKTTQFPSHPGNP
jgi:hypothetical protein